MKRQYITPAIRLMVYVNDHMICTSINGVSGTANLSTDLSDETTDEVLSRRKSGWDDEE